ncbi:CPBP family intramembrane glutamic endopeptidase [Nesterenkonia alba]|uniref:CPBP family intramembrane glutamic endopeptidase n=1 Tax=Nesterenkonia alba TaxID=515814 RepID=UPI0003B46266|nr:CPBP family intramembrane glutamic endopeptidase [Nesterenkonia alba]
MRTTPEIGIQPPRRFYAWEVGIILALSLGRSAVYAVLQLAERLQVAPLTDQIATVQRSRSRHEIFDAAYQFLDVVFGLMPVALVLYLLFLHGVNPLRHWGLDLRRPGADALFGVGLFTLIGAGTLVVYSVGRSLGVTAQIVPADVTQYWWTPVALLAGAVHHSLLEEVIMVAYLCDRARRIWPQVDAGFRQGCRGRWWPGWPVWLVIGASALLRGTYHLYQGFGPGVGNLIMGLIFGWFYYRYGRVMPLVVAHFLLDAVAFLAFPLVLSTFGLSGI